MPFSSRFKSGADGRSHESGGLYVRIRHTAALAARREVDAVWRDIFAAARASLGEADRAVADLRGDVLRLQSRAGDVAQRLATLDLELAPVVGPVSARTTVAVALRSHPHAAAVFASLGLPACSGCSVRFDETLAEVADAYGLNLDHLLQGLQSCADGAKAGAGDGGHP